MNDAVRRLNPEVFEQDEPPFVPPARTNARATGKDFEREVEQTGIALRSNYENKGHRDSE